MPNGVGKAHLFKTDEARDGFELRGNKEIADLGEGRLRGEACCVTFGMGMFCFFVALEDAGLQSVNADEPMISFFTPALIIVLTGELASSQVWKNFFPWRNAARRDRPRCRKLPWRSSGTS